MKFLPVVVVAVVGMVARVSAADSPQEMIRKTLETTVKGKDTNNNGYIDKDEMGGDQAFKGMLASGIDTNSDGKVSIDEYVDFSMQKAPDGQGGSDGLPNPDLNSDGFITKDEATAIAPPNTVTDACWNAMVKRADTNNDKKITTQEFMADASSGEMPEACSLGGASSMKAAFSLLSVFALALRLF